MKWHTGTINMTDQELIAWLRDLGDHASFEPHMHHTAADRIEELEAKLAKAVGLLSRAIDLTGEPHCYYDHHGYCQAHNLDPRGECWVEQSQAFIAALKGSKDE